MALKDEQNLETSVLETSVLETSVRATGTIGVQYSTIWPALAETVLADAVPQID